MFDLFTDPQTIPFVQNSHIRLPKLKHEIDRRILKLMAMVKNTHSNTTQCISPHQKIKKLITQEVQTESTPVLPVFSQKQSIESKPLGISKKHNPNILNNKPQKITTSNKKVKRTSQNNQPLMQKIKQRPLRQHRQTSILYEQPQFIKQEIMPTLLQSNGFTFKRIDFSRNPSSVDLEHIQQVQHQHFSAKKEDHDQFRKIPMKLSCIEMCNTEQYLKNQKYLDYRDNARSEIGRMSLKTEISRHSANNYSRFGTSQKRVSQKPKRKQTQPSLPQPQQQRLFISANTIQKLQKQVQELIPRRRKQFCDNKVRLNMLKKIESSYSRQLYDN